MSEILTRSGEVPAGDGNKIVYPEILTRSDGVLGDVDFAHRLIDIIAVPWDAEARVFWRGDFWTEVFERGAFKDIESAAGKIRVNREHKKGETVGKVVKFDPSHEQGLFAQVEIVMGPKGDEVLHLANRDMVSASIGYRTGQLSDVVLDKQAMTRRVKKAYLDHLSMVEDPAFKEARVLAVRGDGVRGAEAAEGPLPETPVLDEMMRDPVIAWVMQRKAS